MPSAVHARGEARWGRLSPFNSHRGTGGKMRDTGGDVEVSKKTPPRAGAAGINAVPAALPGAGRRGPGGQDQDQDQDQAPAGPPPGLPFSPPPPGVAAPRRSAGAGGVGGGRRPRRPGAGPGPGGAPPAVERARGALARRRAAAGGGSGGRRGRAAPPPGAARRGGAAPAGAVRGRCGAGRGLGALAGLGARLPGRRAAERKANNAVKICLQKIDNCWIRRIQV